ncbi:MAG: hypothetical protein HQM11_14155 [SAR324 cluster bacterium]|nr:hypothetical protein [SAR324 cluster bacterium]
MMWLRSLVLGMFFLWVCHSAVFAAVVHLNSGESLSGRIQKLDEQILSLESDRGFGVLHIERADIRLIEFDKYHPDLSRKFGVGFYQKHLSLTSQSTSGEYGTGAISIKNWLSATDSINLLWGYAETRDGGTTLLSVLSLEMRFSRVFLQEGNHHLYWGLGAGHLNVIDSQASTNSSGGSFQAVLGVELFPITFPNLGIAAEIGVSNQSIADRVSFSMMGPAVAMHYYF